MSRTAWTISELLATANWASCMDSVTLVQWIPTASTISSKMPFFFLLSCTVEAGLICHRVLPWSCTVTFMISGSQSCCKQWGFCGARKHWGAAGSYPHYVGQGDRRKAVLSSAAARFSFDIFIAFNNFLCFVTSKSPWQGAHGLPGITAGCSHVTSVCHCLHGVLGMHFVCSGLFVLQDWPRHRDVSEFHLPSTHTWEHSALAQGFGPAAHTGIGDLLHLQNIYLSSEKTWNAWQHKVSEDAKGDGAEWFLHYIAKQA